MPPFRQKRRRILVAAVACWAMCAGALPADAGDAAAVIGVNYGPFRMPGQRPAAAAGILEDQLAEDLRLISGAGFRRVRIYGLDRGLDRLVPLAHRLFPDLRLFIGVYVCGLNHDDPRRPGSTRSQLQEAVRLANRYPNVAGIVVGNECLAGEPEACFQPVTVEQLVADMRWVQGGLSPDVRKTVMVTTALSMAAAAGRMAAEGRRAAEAGDAVMVNIHPFFAPSSVEDAVRFNLDGSYRRIAELYAGSGKPIVIGETGWPSAGAPNGPAVPGPRQQERFVRDLFGYAAGRHVQVFVFEMFDEPWKAETGGVGPHWGVFDSSGRAKFDLPWKTALPR